MRTIKSFATEAKELVKEMIDLQKDGEGGASDDTKMLGRY